MTTCNGIQSVEARKAIYSQELAAHTRRQWDMARQAVEDGSGSQAAQPSSQQQESPSCVQQPDSETPSRRRHGVQAHDYAQTAYRHVDDQRNMAAGKM
ncbi:hypothetical protein LXA43DRAFT_1088724 [Ganoderma leucocontextum]|nr:hypothetical protein LXA43DRAFT_1088724 [Ganoderma leucocontextum]